VVYGLRSTAFESKKLSRPVECYQTLNSILHCVYDAQLLGYGGWLRDIQYNTVDESSACKMSRTPLAQLLHRQIHRLASGSSCYTLSTC
jgi:hypothetical protein